jgi:L-lactate dehydrogenase
MRRGGIEIQLLDANQALAEGEALDLLHGAAFTADQRIYAGDYARAADSDLFLITAGLRRKPDESRLDLINRNVALFTQICDQVQRRACVKERLRLRGLQSGGHPHPTCSPALEP